MDWPLKNRSTNRKLKHLKLNRRIYYLSILCAASFSCTKENAPPKTLQLGQSELTVDAPAGSTTISLSSNTNWTVTNTVDWLTVSPSSGKGNSVLTVTYAAMTNMDQRTGSFTVQAGGLQQKVDVTQDQRIKLLQVQGILGNLETGVLTTVVLTFNTSVDVSDIQGDLNLCAPVEAFTVSGSQVTFSYPCTAIGTSYPFTINLTNGYTFSFELYLYKNKLNIAGKTVDYFITDDNSSLWAITQSPNQLVNLSLPDLTILKTLPLGFIPEKLRWNYYHGKLMVFNPSANDSTFRYVDPISLAITKVHVEAYNGAYSGFGLQHASDMCQMSDGSGIMQTKQFAGPYGWRYINNNDSTWLIPSDYGPGTPIGYEAIFTNYDQTEMIMMYPYGSTLLDVWKMGTGTFQTYTPPYQTAGVLIVVNKKMNLVYDAQSLSQFIIDLNGYVSNSSYIFPLDYKGADFSYRPNEEKVVYITTQGSFVVLDYVNAYTNLSTPINRNFVRLQSTTDGKYITGFIDNGNSADFCVFDLNTILVNATKYGSIKGGRVRSNGNNSYWAPH